MPLRSTPWTIHRCRKRNITSSGRIEITAAMNSWCRLLVCWVRNVDRAIWTVQELWSWPMTSGQRNAFQLPMKVIVPIAATNPSEFGTTTRQKVPK